MMFPSPAFLWRRRVLPAAMGIAALTLTGVGLTTGPKALMDGPSRVPDKKNDEEEPKSEKERLRKQKAEGEKAQRQKSLDVAKEFCAFADSSPSVYHAVETVKQHLLQQSFVEIEEKNPWADDIEPGGKYFVTRSGGSGSSIIAFAVGKLWQPGNPFAIVATHVDSPCLKLKPVPEKEASGFRLLGVETYGGGLWHTWFDRDLGVAGRAYVRTSPTTIESQLVKLDEALIRVPSLAVHLQKQNPFSFSIDHHLQPVTSQKSGDVPATTLSPELEPQRVLGPWQYAMSSSKSRHGDLLISKIAAQLNTHPENIMDVDLSLYDLQKATLGGLNQEFIYSARIDNLMMSFCALKSFTQTLSSTAALDDETSVRTLVMFDHEEIGSAGPIGAQSTFLPQILHRISSIQVPHFNSTTTGSPSITTNTNYEQAIARSFLISADVHHGKHPNYASTHEINHTPYLNAGIIFASSSRKPLSKTTPGTIMMLELMCKLEDQQQSLTTTTTSSPVLARGRPLAPPKSQFWVAINGNDCGSTVGPHLEANLGIRTLDMGNPALSMHSIREMAGTFDVENAVRVFELFWRNYSEFENWVVVK